MPARTLLNGTDPAPVRVLRPILAVILLMVGLKMLLG